MSIESYEEDYADDDSPLELSQKLSLTFFLFILFGSMILAGWK